MFPFAFRIPLASRENSPAVNAGPLDAAAQPPIHHHHRRRQKNHQYRGRSQSCSSGCSHGSDYTQKKAHWKCNLRQAHPFISREPHNWCLEKRASSQTEQSKGKNSSQRRTCTRVRQVLFFAAFLFAVAILVLGLVYAKLVSRPQATPGGQLNAPLPSPTSRAAASASVPPGRGLLMRSPTVTNIVSSSTQVQGSTVQSVQPESISSIMSEVEEAGRRYSSVIALFFYVATMPLVTIVHISGEMLVGLILFRLARRRSPASDQPPSIHDDEDSFGGSDSETLHNEEKFKHELAYPAPPIAPQVIAASKDQSAKSRLGKAQRYVATMSLIVSILIVVGWVVVNTVQTHCEIVEFGDKEICNAQTQLNHRLPMNTAIRPLSISRASLSWVIVVVYVAQIVILCKHNTFVSLRSHKKAQSPSDIQHGPAEMVTQADDDCPPPYSSPPNSTPVGILRSRSSSSSSAGSTRSRSSSTRRKTVRFNLEDASRKQSERGDDVQYIPAPGSDVYKYTGFYHLSQHGQDGEIGTAVGYGLSHGTMVLDPGNDASSGGPIWYTSTTNVKTPWQWQGTFEDFKADDNTDPQMVAGTSQIRSLTASPTHIIPRKPVPASAHARDQKVQDELISQGMKEGAHIRGDSFDFGLASVKPVIHVEEAEEQAVEDDNDNDHQVSQADESIKSPNPSLMTTPPTLLRQSASSDAAVPEVPEQPASETVGNLPATTYIPSRPAPRAPFTASPRHPLSSHPSTHPPSAPAFPTKTAPHYEQDYYASEAHIDDNRRQSMDIVSSTPMSISTLTSSSSLRSRNSQLRVSQSDSDMRSEITLSAILSDYGAPSSRLGVIAEEL